MDWLNRGGHYLAGLYGLVAVWTTYQLARHKGAGFQHEMTTIFQQSQLLYAVLVEMVAEPTVTTDQDFKITHWNSAAQRLLGLSNEEFQAHATLDSSWKIIQEDGSVFTSDRRPSQLVFRTGLAVMNVVMGIYKPCGTLIWVLLNAVPVFANNGSVPSSVVVTFSDITRHKEAERETQRIFNQLKATLDAIPDLWFQMDLEGKYCDVRSPRADLLLNPAQALLGKYVSDVLPAKAAAVVMAALQETQASGYSNGKIYSLPLAKGETWFELSISRKTTDPGEEPRFIVVSRDITQQQLDEVQIKRSLRTPSQGDKLILPGLNLAQAAQMFGGHRERYGQLLHKFVAQHGTDVEEARRRFSAGNTQGAMLLMHHISGVAGFLQAPALSRLAASAESAMQDDRSDQLLVLFDELQAAMDTVKSSLAQFDAAMAWGKA